MVYFMQSPKGGPIKIGYSKNPEYRRYVLQSHFGHQLKILAVSPGGRREEHGFHVRFGHLYMGNHECFFPACDLTDFIASLPPYEDKLIRPSLQWGSLARVAAMLDCDEETAKKHIRTGMIRVKQILGFADRYSMMDTRKMPGFNPHRERRVAAKSWPR